MSKCNMDCFNCIYDDCIEGGGAPRRKAEYKDERYARARSDGLCGACYKAKATRGVFCEKCYERQKQRYKVTDIRKRRQRWKLSKEVELFVDDLIACGYSAGSVYAYRLAVEKFFSLFDEVTAENAGTYKEILVDEYSHRTARSKISAFNQYCNFIGKPQCMLSQV